MDEEKVTNESTIEETVVTPAVLSDVVEETAEVSLGKRKFTGRRDGDRKKNTRRMPRKDDRIKPEFDQKIIGIRRVTRVVAGGRRMSFSVAVVAGNRKGKVGVGVPIQMRRATRPKLSWKPRDQRSSGRQRIRAQAIQPRSARRSYRRPSASAVSSVRIMRPERQTGALKGRIAR